MTIDDIIEGIANVINEKIDNIEVYTEWEENAERPSVYINCVDSSRQFISNNKELLKASFDIAYFPTSPNESRNKEIRQMLENINHSFDNHGKKYVKVLDRSLTIKDVTTRIVDNIGHYLIDMEIYIPYGEEKQYEKMEKLEIGGIL